MFFYNEDYWKYKLHIHTETKNESFIRMYLLLKKMNIKNNKFMLYLADKELRNIDVHSLTDVSPELAARIAREAKINPWYFMREIVRVPSQGGAASPYEIHRGNMALIWCFFQSVHTYLRLPRQHFKTVSAMANIAQLMYLGTKHFPMAMFTKDSGSVNDNINRLKEIRDGFPTWLIAKSYKDSANTAQVTYSALHNSLRSIVASNTELGADSRAKGGSMAVQLLENSKYFYFFANPRIKTERPPARYARVAYNEVIYMLKNYG